MKQVWVRACGLAMREVDWVGDSAVVDVRAVCDVFAAALGHIDVSRGDLEDHLVEVHRVTRPLATRLGDIYEAVDYVLVEGPDESWCEDQIGRPRAAAG